MDMEKDACEPLRVLRDSLCIRAGTYIATWSRLERDTHKKGAQVLLITITPSLRRDQTDPATCGQVLLSFTVPL